MCTVDRAKRAVERTERQVAGAASSFEDQTVGEADRRATAKLFERRPNHFGILQHELSMRQEHLDRGRDCLRRSTVDGRQHPDSFRKSQMRDPRAVFDESLGGRGLRGIVARDQPDEDVGINGVHDAF
jgi:hypothetical protein